MKEKKYCIKGFFIVFLFSLGACATFSKEDSLVSDSYNAGTSSRQQASAKNYQPLTGHMDHVEYYINKDLMQNGLEREDNEFSELRSTFESSGRNWTPTALKGFNIPVVRNEKVERWVRYFTGPLRSHFERWLGRASMYAPIMEQVLREYNLPTDLIYLSMIESGFNMRAYSRARASGPWQFIKTTGSMYGLQSGGMVDERRDLLKATRAAAAHLRDLYQMYGDWYLAFAAYNAGPGTVNRAIQRAGTRNFWVLASDRSRYFRQETKDYVPRILAAAIIAKNYKHYGFSANTFDRPLNFEVVNVPDATDIGMIAQCAGVSVDEIKFLNPALIKGITPPGQNYSVLVPAGSASNFRKNYAKISHRERTDFVIYRVKGKETPANIASRYGVSVKQLLALNRDIANPRQKLSRGNTVIVPSRQKSPGKLDKTLEAALLPAPSRFAAAEQADSFTERQGAVGEESWDAGRVAPDEGSIAGVISNSNRENKTGQRQGAALHSTPKTYHVKRGDTLGKIAARYGVAVASLRQWNDMGPRESLKAGQVLKIANAQEISQPVKTGPEPPRQPLKIMPVDKRRDERKIVFNAPQTFESKNAGYLQASDRLIIHAVRRGETLTDISRRYRVPVDLIRKWNSLNSNQISPNQKIKIYSQIGVFPSKNLALVR